MVRSAGTWALAIAVAIAAGCEEKKSGGLMLAIQTDMSAPKDVDEVGLFITSDGRPIFSDTRQVAPNGEVKFPATLAIVGSEERSQAVIRIRTVAFQKTKARVLRDVKTTAPAARVALLRVPLQWLSDGSVTGSSSDLVDAFRQLQSVCPEGQTSVAGECASAAVDAASLPDYSPSEVFGGGSPEGDGKCFEVNDCFDAGGMVTPDLTTCTWSGSAISETTNVALVVVNAGECGKGKDEVCSSGLVALNRDGEGGWREQGGQIKLPPAVCKKLADRTIQGVVVSNRCPSKTERNPLCSKASVMTGGTTSPGASSSADGGVAVVRDLVNPDFRDPVNATPLSEPYPMGLATNGVLAFVGRQGAPSGNPAFGAFRFRLSDGAGLAALWEQPNQPRRETSYWRMAVQPNAAFGIAIESTLNLGIVFSTAENAPQPTPFAVQPGSDAVAASSTQAFWSYREAGGATRIVAMDFGSSAPVVQPAAPFAERITALHWHDGYLYGGTDKARVFRCAATTSARTCDTPATYEDLFLPLPAEANCSVGGITAHGGGSDVAVFWTAFPASGSAASLPACSGVWSRPMAANGNASRLRGGDVFSGGPTNVTLPRAPGPIAADARYVYFYSYMGTPLSIKRDGSGPFRYRMNEVFADTSTPRYVSGIAVTDKAVWWSLFTDAQASGSNVRRADKVGSF